ncbi:MAG: alanine dehydrogenase [Coriobacteriia bacterium]|nr:alanine dehydrogenase [Coriobacteriia bacterium]
MIVGVPKEIKEDEYRVGMTPGGVKELVAHGHRVLVENGAGTGSAITDDEYATVGAELVPSAGDVYEGSDLIIKVKEPQPSEIAMIRDGQVIFAFLHLAPNRQLTEGLMESGAVCIAYETVEGADGSLPLLAPMSEIAGRMSAQVGAEYLQKPKGGRGVLMGGVPGVLPAKAAILGGGVVGTNAAFVASGMGAEVTIVDIDIDRLRYLEEIWTGRFRTLYSNRHNIEQIVSAADLVIGAALVPGATAPRLVTRDMLPGMKEGAVIVDVAVDQGGCVETTHATTHHDPVFVEEGVLHYGVANIPGAVPSTSTNALTNATMRYVVALADKGWEEAVRGLGELAGGVNVVRGVVTCRPVAQAHGFAYTPLEDVSR